MRRKAISCGQVSGIWYGSWRKERSWVLYTWRYAKPKCALQACSRRSVFTWAATIDMLTVSLTES